MALMILAVRIVILVIRDIRQATGVAGRARVRLWVMVHSAGEAGQSQV
jgi:hypothetical protein